MCTDTYSRNSSLFREIASLITNMFRFHPYSISGRFAEREDGNTYQEKDREEAGGNTNGPREGEK